MCVMVALDPPSPMTHAPELEAVIHRCLEKNPDHRYANVAELMRDLAMFAGDPEAAKQYMNRAYRVLGLGIPTGLDSNPIIPRVVSYQTPVAGVHTSALHLTQLPRAAVVNTTMRDEPVRPIKPRRSRGLGFAIAIAAVLAAGGVVAVLTLNQHEQTSPQQLVVDDGDAGVAEPDRGSSGSARVTSTGSGSADQGSDVASGSAASATGSAIGSAGSATIERGTDAGSGSASTVSTRPIKPKPFRPRPPKPVKPGKGSAAVPEPVKPPPPKPPPKCDPFAGRKNC
jgi:serine/threonine-protein kinase